MQWIDYAIAILSGLSVCIPLVIQLVKFVKQSIEEKNWAEMVKVVLSLMTQAEKLFIEGAAKKAWVMAEVRVAAQNINYNYDEVAEKKVSDMIDAICEAAKEINVVGEIKDSPEV